MMLSKKLQRILDYRLVKGLEIAHAENWEEEEINFLILINIAQSLEGINDNLMEICNELNKEE